MAERRRQGETLNQGLAFDILLAELSLAIQDHGVMERVRRALFTLAGYSIRIPKRGYSRHEAIKAARRMLDAHLLRREIRDALMVRFCVSRRTAYRILQESLDRPAT